jgi:AraC-like DNA-binding protein
MGTVGPGGASDAHAHHALHIVMCVRGELRARGAAGPWSRARGVVTAPDAPHAIDAAGAEVALVFVEPESDLGVELLRALRSEVQPLERLPIARPLDAPALVRAAIASLGGAREARARRVHPRVRRVLRALNGGAEGSLAELAALAGLSEGRLMHVFTESVGVPLRPYVAWLKVQRAAAAIASGAPLARAAAEGGFADAAHMTRSFRRTFGMTPSAIRSQMVQAAAARAP